jgi:hypothetical protein
MKQSAEEKEKEKEALEAKILELKPGSTEALAFFATLPDLIEELMPRESEQVKFISNVVKSVWFKRQGGPSSVYYLILSSQALGSHNA